MKDVPPIENASTGLIRLNDKYQVNFYLTSRLTSAQEVTENWIKTHNFPTAPVICRSPEIIEPNWKLDYIPQYAPQTVAFIDNEVHWNAEINFAGKIFEIVRHRQHNILSERIRVCKDWQEIISELS